MANNQKIIYASDDYAELNQYFIDNSIKKPMLVCGNSIKRLSISSYFQTVQKRLGVEIVYFSDFCPNPKYESVVKGVQIFNSEDCDGIVAVGGGSAIDVAKCIKLYANMNHKENYLQQEIIANDIPFLAIPTTAGTGSEATRFAVIYYQGKKQSVTHISSIPGTVVFDPEFLDGLPLYQKKVTMMDALCHSIESMWSVNSTDESRMFAKQAIELILQNKEAYLKGEKQSYSNMLKASFLAGQAINITQTTAGHAMSYKLTSLYGIAHGHAVALCNKSLLEYMLDNTDKCIDTRGEVYLKSVFAEMKDIFGSSGRNNLAKTFENIVDEFEFEIPKAKESDFEILRESVNPDRLKNNPVFLSADTIDALYHKILSY